MADEVPYPMEARALGNVAVLRLVVDGSNAGSWILEDVLPKAHQRLLDEAEAAVEYEAGSTLEVQPQLVNQLD